ncbi:hypothetical protein PFISCL1PPCAC_4866 [Pristionchus fissidentatus]|uniref:Uncharacterized protein n=1 Tax=Pristionchus fissidentatus TaxID=1538716 RepID=A0AAV5V6Q1_9BILA|nr:hypothetical protein PFISCL1PPCAC_4866 [Pristionchus fissidentatus]
MIFECLLLFFFASFAISSLGVAAFHLSQALGILPVTDLAISLSLRAETVRQMISLTFFCANLAAIGLAACVFSCVHINNSRVRLPHSKYGIFC